MNVYETDASEMKGKAKEIYLPETIEELQNIVRKENRILIRGGGSGLSGAVPDGDAVLSLEKLDRIAVDEGKRIAEVEAGVVLNNLNLELLKYNLEFPVDLSSGEIATIGGILALNSGGSREIRYGPALEWVKDMDIVDCYGQLKTIGILDLTDFIGMEGITGVIVKARLKLIEKPKRTAVLLKTDEMNKIIEQVMKLKRIKEVSMAEFFDKEVSELVGWSRQYHLLVELESDKGKLKDKDYEKVMETKEEVYQKLALIDYSRFDDVKLFIEKIPEFISWTEKNNLRVTGHIGKGLLRVYYMPSQKNLAREMIKVARKLHGKINVFGTGRKKKDFFDINDKKLIERIKRRYDPLWKFNRGIFVDYQGGENGKESI